MAAPAKAKPSGLIGKIAGSLFRSKAKPVAQNQSFKPDATPSKKPATEKENWTANRLNVVERLCGSGYTTPGGAAHVKRLLPMLGLDEKKSLLLLGAGMGGISETIVEDTGVWVTGYEPDKELAKIGMESMKRSGLQRKAPIRFDFLEKLQLKPKSYNAMMAFDSLHCVSDKKALFSAVEQSLRLDGEMLFLSYVLPDTNPPSTKVEIWARNQLMTPYLWPAEAMLGMLKSLNLDVRPPDDVTLEFRQCVLQAWLGLLSKLKKAELLAIAVDLVGECERWVDLITAIDTGGLKVMKYHCIKLPDQRKSVNELMG